MNNQHAANNPDNDRIRREAREWVVRLASGQATSADGEAFRRWCARSPAQPQAFTECRQVWRGMQQAAEPTASPVASLGGARERRFSRRALLGGAVAASVGWVALRSPLDLWPDASALSSDLWTATGEQREVVLPQAATVLLNTQTRVDLQRRNDTVTGLVLRSGETEITTVANTRDFMVSAGQGRIAAGRARFNVRYTDERVRVTCLEGEVDVAHGAQRSRLGPAQQVVYNDIRLTDVQDVDTRRVSAWRQRVLVFDGMPLNQVVDEVNRYRPGRIVLLDDRLGRTPVQAYLSLDRLDDFATLVREVHGANVRSLPGGVLIIS